jgi:meso-butanediol dehydrogenase/(S,S)-butanediol dehydrogenase/diacetyl reductase
MTEAISVDNVGCRTPRMQTREAVRVSLAGKTALVTGAGRGIGRAVGDRLRSAGAIVVYADVETIEAQDGRACIVADVRDSRAMTAAVEAAAAPTGRLDICVANAGIAHNETLIDGDWASWLAVMEVNVLGVMTTFQAAARHMLGQPEGGRLLATSSGAGLRGESGSSAYCASKGAVATLVQSLACELAPYGITVNGVAPGEIATDLQSAGLRQRAERAGREADEFLAEMLQRDIPAGRLGTPAEVADVFAFLASPSAAYVTGEILRVDGGQLLV